MLEIYHPWDVLSRYISFGWKFIRSPFIPLILTRVLIQSVFLTIRPLPVVPESFPSSLERSWFSYTFPSRSRGTPALGMFPRGSRGIPAPFTFPCAEPVLSHFVGHWSLQRRVFSPALRLWWGVFPPALCLRCGTLSSRSWSLVRNLLYSLLVPTPLHYWCGHVLISCGSTPHSHRLWLFARCMLVVVLHTGLPNHFIY